MVMDDRKLNEKIEKKKKKKKKMILNLDDMMMMMSYCMPIIIIIRSIKVYAFFRNEQIFVCKERYLTVNCQIDEQKQTETNKQKQWAQ